MIRHARAATARIAIAYQRTDVVIQIDDDGRGLDVQEPPAAGGNGLLGMRERTTALGGDRGRADCFRRVPRASAIAPRRNDMIRVLIVDDQALVRAGFRALLDAEEDIQVIGEATDGLAAVGLRRNTYRTWC